MWQRQPLVWFISWRSVGATLDSRGSSGKCAWIESSMESLPSSASSNAAKQAKCLDVEPMRMRVRGVLAMPCSMLASPSPRR
ncbi:hypothetical protein D3C87_1364740 [compost metagenome]